MTEKEAGCQNSVFRSNEFYSEFFSSAVIPEEACLRSLEADLKHRIFQLLDTINEKKR
jgi:hypothetical protein